MYSVVNIDNLNLYDPIFIMETEEVGQVPRVDGFAPKYLDKLLEDITIDRRTRNY